MGFRKRLPDVPVPFPWEATLWSLNYRAGVFWIRCLQVPTLRPVPLRKYVCVAIPYMWEVRLSIRQRVHWEPYLSGLQYLSFLLRYSGDILFVCRFLWVRSSVLKCLYWFLLQIKHGCVMFLLHEYYINVSIKGDMNINEMNPINSFLFLCACPNFAPETKNDTYEFQRKTVAFGPKETFRFTLYPLCGRSGFTFLLLSLCFAQTIYCCHVWWDGTVRDGL